MLTGVGQDGWSWGQGGFLLLSTAAEQRLWRLPTCCWYCWSLEGHGRATCQPVHPPPSITVHTASSPSAPSNFFCQVKFQFSPSPLVGPLFFLRLCLYSWFACFKKFVVLPCQSVMSGKHCQSLAYCVYTGYQGQNSFVIFKISGPNSFEMHSLLSV